MKELIHFKHSRKLKGTKGKEGIGLFHNAHNTFYLCLYGINQMVKNHSDSERENSLATSWANLSH